MNTKYKRAIFLDREGTIIENSCPVSDISKVKIYDESFDALKLLQDEFSLFIIINQPEINEGKISKYKADKINAVIIEEYFKKGIKISKIYCCPHRPEEKCWCGKPEPYFIHKAIKDYKIDINCSYIIGDCPEEMHLAENVGAKGVYLLSGDGTRNLHKLAREPIIAYNILHAANLIVNQPLKND